MEIKGLHLVTGEKGGVGKSLFSMCLLEYCISKNIPYRFYDADRTSPDVGMIYAPEAYKEVIKKDQYKSVSQTTTAQIYFSEDEEDEFLANSLIDEATEHLTLVNLPAQVGMIVDRWLLERGILEIAISSGIPLWFWFVSDGSPESLELLQRSLINYQEGVEHIIILNEGLNKRALANLEAHAVYKIVKDRKASVISLPELWLSNEHKHSLKSQKKRLGDVNSSNQFTLIARTAIYRFLQETIQQIGKTSPFCELASDAKAVKEVVR